MIPAIYKRISFKKLVCSIAAQIYCCGIKIQFILFQIIQHNKAVKSYLPFQHWCTS